MSAAIRPGLYRDGWSFWSPLCRPRPCRANGAGRPLSGRRGLSRSGTMNAGRNRQEIGKELFVTGSSRVVSQPGTAASPECEQQRRSRNERPSGAVHLQPGRTPLTGGERCCHRHMPKMAQGMAEVPQSREIGHVLFREKPSLFAALKSLVETNLCWDVLHQCRVQISRKKTRLRQARCTLGSRRTPSLRPPPEPTEYP